MATSSTNPNEEQAVLLIRMARLIARERLGDLTDEEKAALAQWLGADERSREWVDRLTPDHIAEMAADYDLFEARVEATLTRFHERHLGQASVVSLQRRGSMIWRIAAAVLIPLLVIAVWLDKRQAPGPAVAKNDTAVIQPGRYTAMLTLANGNRLRLDTGKSGQVVQNGNVLAKYQDGKVAYDGKPAAPEQVEYNTLATARGGQYQLQLPDGTKVWLNAASSIRYPTSFEGKQRRVELTGEGYFEVADRKDQPFVVKVGAMDVTVLGTEFDIMAYPEEGAKRTTLIKGAVKVESDGMQQALQPDQQSIVTPDGLMTVAPGVDVENVIAWKFGFFQFRNLDIQTIMRQIQRWYDVDVIYKTKTLPEQYGGRISRNLNLSELISLLEGSGVGHFKIEGRKLIVLP